MGSEQTGAGVRMPPIAVFGISGVLVALVSPLIPGLSQIGIPVYIRAIAAAISAILIVLWTWRALFAVRRAGGGARLLLCLVIGCSLLAALDFRVFVASRAIARVVRDAAEANSELLRQSFGPPQAAVRRGDKFVHELSQIDLSGVPREFRNAFEDYTRQQGDALRRYIDGDASGYEKALSRVADEKKRLAQLCIKYE